MKTTETVTRYSCDICGKENINPRSVMHKELFGFRPVQAFGVEVYVRAFGEQAEHVCADCAKAAIIAAAKELAK